MPCPNVDQSVSVSKLNLDRIGKSTLRYRIYSHHALSDINLKLVLNFEDESESSSHH